MYQIINKYNNSNLESKMCGNLWSLKQKIKEDCLKSLRKCEINNCNICLLDNWRNYEKYMSKWLCIDFIHHFSINVFIVVVFFQCTQKKLNCWTTGGILRSICPNDFALILFIHEGLHHFSIDVFIVVFFIVFRRNLFIFLGCSPSPSHPCHFPPLLFKLKTVNPFQTCQWTDTFVKYSLLLPFFSKKGKQHKEDNINIIFLGFQNKPSLEDTGVPAYM